MESFCKKAVAENILRMSSIGSGPGDGGICAKVFEETKQIVSKQINI